jgi:hypothetical protein
VFCFTIELPAPIIYEEDYLDPLKFEPLPTSDALNVGYLRIGGFTVDGLFKWLCYYAYYC